MRPWGRVVLATLLVAVLPVATVWALWALGVVTSPWVAAPLAVALALLASFAGGTYWKRRPGTGDVLFGDLLLWGWLRRLRAERRAADAVELLARAGAGDEAEKRRLLKRLAAALDAKDLYLDGHSHRVARFSTVMARRLGVSREEADRVRTAAAMHDVGKLHVPDELLSKPDALTDSEAEVVHRHADDGAAIVACLGDPALSAIVRHHHERFDGAGYPAGLKGEDIPLGARIVAVADTFDAITSARPYRPAGTHKMALDVLAAEAGTQLDPVVVRAFTRGYARRRGLVLWALLTLPLERARRQPLPVGVVLGTMLVLGAAATVVQVGGAERGRAPDAAHAGIAAPAVIARNAGRRPKHESADPARRPTLRVATPRPTGHATLVSSVTRRPAAQRRPAREPQHRVTPRRPTGPRTAAPRPVATPRPVRTPRPAAPAPTATSPAAATQPPASSPAASPVPTSAAPVSTPSPAPASAQQCKKGGYAAYGYRNQGQCVATQNRP